MVSWLIMKLLSNGEKICAALFLLVLLRYLGREVVVADGQCRTSSGI
jgi:hypothetical protein